ncbi:MAG: hypothetical protein IJ269_01330 [Bacteroidales bacterium]|nr:hypothetical protein [Bacteroidales bacterium]
MKQIFKRWLCALIYMGHDYQKVTETGKNTTNEMNQQLYVCSRCGKTKWFWEA